MYRGPVPGGNSFSGLKNYMYEKYGNLAEMGPYGSVWADIKTGKSPMAQDHFQTPPDPKRGYKIQKNPKKVLKSVPNQPSYG